MNVFSSARQLARFLVLDCQGLSSLDALAAKSLAKIATVYQKVGVTTCLAAVNGKLYGNNG